MIFPSLLLYLSLVERGFYCTKVGHNEPLACGRSSKEEGHERTLRRKASWVG